jgi:hypothetical protein
MIGTTLLLLSADGTGMYPRFSSEARDILAERELLGGGPGGGPGNGAGCPLNCCPLWWPCWFALSAPVEAERRDAGGAGGGGATPDGMYTVFLFVVLIGLSGGRLI